MDFAKDVISFEKSAPEPSCLHSVWKHGVIIMAALLILAGTAIAAVHFDAFRHWKVMLGSAGITALVCGLLGFWTVHKTELAHWKKALISAVVIGILSVAVAFFVPHFPKGVILTGAGIGICLALIASYVYYQYSKGDEEYKFKEKQPNPSDSGLSEADFNDRMKKRKNRRDEETWLDSDSPNVNSNAQQAKPPKAPAASDKRKEKRTAVDELVIPNQPAEAIANPPTPSPTLQPLMNIHQPRRNAVGCDDDGATDATSSSAVIVRERVRHSPVDLEQHGKKPVSSAPPPKKGTNPLKRWIARADEISRPNPNTPSAQAPQNAKPLQGGSRMSGKGPAAGTVGAAQS